MKKLKVKTLKHGDVKYYLSNRKKIITDLLNIEEQKQVKHLNSKEEDKSIYCQGKIEAFNQALNLLADFEKYIERYTCREVQELNNCNLNKIL